MSNPTAFQVALLVIAILMIVVVFTWDAADAVAGRLRDALVAGAGDKRRFDDEYRVLKRKVAVAIKGRNHWQNHWYDTWLRHTRSWSISARKASVVS